MTVGRKRVPSALRLVSGVSTNKVSADEPKVRRALREPPEWLSAEQKAVWYRKIDDCPTGMLRSLDDDVLASYAVAVVERNHAIKRLQKKTGRTIRTKKGNVIQDPDVGLMNKQTLIISKLASELGFSPTSRARLKVPHGSEDTNPFKDHAAKRSA